MKSVFGNFFNVEKTIDKNGHYLFSEILTSFLVIIPVMIHYRRTNGYGMGGISFDDLFAHPILEGTLPLLVAIVVVCVILYSKTKPYFKKEKEAMSVNREVLMRQLIIAFVTLTMALIIIFLKLNILGSITSIFVALLMIACGNSCVRIYLMKKMDGIEQ